MTEYRLNAKLQNNYADYYRDGDSEWRRLGALGKAENILFLCKDLPQDSVLEIGTGEGSLLKRLSDLDFGKELYAIEISPSGLEIVRGKEIPRLVECSLFDGYTIPYDDERFDIAILSHVIEHVEHPRRLLYEASRVARFVFVEVPLEDTIRLSDDYVFDKVGHINFFSPKTIRRLIQTCDLKVVHQVITNPPKATYQYQGGRKGLINYYIKQGLLRLSAPLATGLFTYHAALLCMRNRPRALGQSMGVIDGDNSP